MYEYSSIVSSRYDNVPIYAARPDVRIYVDEAKASGDNVKRHLETMYGDFDRSPVVDSSKELIVVAEPLSP